MFNPLSAIGHGLATVGRKTGSILGQAGHNFVGNLEGDTPELLGADYTPEMRKHLRAQALSNMFAALGSGQPIFAGIQAAQQNTIQAGMANRQQRVAGEQARQMQGMGDPNTPGYWDNAARMAMSQQKYDDASKAAQRALEIRKQMADSALKPVGPQFEATDSTGEPAMFQTWSDGTTTVVKDVKPKRQTDNLTLGDRLIVTDKNKPGSTLAEFKMGTSPAEQARLDLQKNEVDNLIAERYNPATPPERLAIIDSQLAAHAAQKRAGASNVNQTVNGEQKVFENTEKLTDNFNNEPLVKTAKELQAQAGRVVESLRLATEARAKNGSTNAADQAIVTALNKATDPGSVVRGEEFDRIFNNMGIGSRLAAWKQRVTAGGSMDDATRQEIATLISVLNQAAQRDADAIKSKYMDKAKRFNLPGDMIDMRGDPAASVPSSGAIRWTKDANGNPVRAK